MSQNTIKNYQGESRLFLARAIAAAVVLVVLLALVVARLINLQVIHHDQFTTQSRENRVKLVPLPPTRGLIYDRNGVLLAQNLPTFSLEVTPDRVDDVDSTLKRLGKIIQITDDDRDRFYRLRRQRRRFDSVPIRVRLTEEEVARFSVNRLRFPGVEIAANLVRDYPLGPDLSHVLGYVGRISEDDLDQIDASNYAGTTYIGKLGVEKAYEDVLHGTVGLQQVEVNAMGRVLRVLESDPPVPGKDLYLHLDARLQEVATQALGEYAGAVVAIDPKTGGVLALVSKPGFDPNLFVEGIAPSIYRTLVQSEDRPLFNRALRGQYPPGSTVKPFVGLAGLELGVVGYSDRVFCPGFYRLPGQTHRYRDWKRAGHGSVDLDDAIVQSCDVYFYTLAHAIGVDRLHDFLSQFGFGSRTGIDLVGEMSGLLPSSEWKERTRRRPWYPGETLIMGIGQGFLLVTPIQLATAVATLAADGKHISPRVVDYIQAPGSKDPPEYIHGPVTQLKWRDPADWQHIIEAMVHVVEDPHGTAKRIKTDAYHIGGKTGTAQVFTIKQDERYDENAIDIKLRDHALFIAFAPADDPRIAVAVIAEHGGHGASVAAPVARRVMDYYLLGKDQP